MQKFRSTPTRSQSLDKILASAQLYGIKPALNRVLEIGYGYGDALKHNARIFPNLEFCGIERDEEFLNQKTEAPNLTFSRDPNGKFDIVLAFGIYSWENESILDLISSSLREGGLCVCSFLVRPGFFLRDTLREWIRTNKDLSPRECLRVLKESTPYEFEHPYGLLLHRELSRIEQESDSYINAELVSEKISPKYLTEVAQDFENVGLQYLGDVRPMRTRVRRGLSRVETDLSLDFSHGIPFREGIFVKQSAPITGTAPITKGIYLSASLESVATEEEIEEEFFRKNWPEQYEWESVKLDNLSDLVFKEKIEASTLKFQIPSSLPEKPKVLPKLGRSYANIRYDPVLLGPFEEEIALRSDGTKTLSDIASELQKLMGSDAMSFEETLESVTDGAKTLLKAGLIVG